MNEERYQFLTFDEQVEHLEQKQLTIIDKPNLIKYLSKYNYQNVINSYNDFFLDNLNKSIYKKGTTSLGIINLFEFNKRLSFKLLKPILELESQISTAIVYCLPKFYMQKLQKIKYGRILKFSKEEWDLIFPNYINKKEKEKLSFYDVTKYIKDGNNNLKYDLSIKYGTIENVDIWSLSIFWTFGTLVNIFMSLDYDLQAEVVNFLFPNKNVKNQELLFFMIMINKLRNRICHNNMVYKFSYSDKQNYVSSFVEKIIAKKCKVCRISEIVDILDYFDQNESNLRNDVLNEWQLSIDKNNFYKQQYFSSANVTEDEKVFDNIFKYMHFE